MANWDGPAITGRPTGSGIIALYTGSRGPRYEPVITRGRPGFTLNKSSDDEVEDETDIEQEEELFVRLVTSPNQINMVEEVQDLQLTYQKGVMCFTIKT